MTRCPAWGFVFFSLAAVAAAADDPVFDVPALIATPLNPRTLKTTERDGVITEEVMFHSETDGDKDVEIFAFFSYPKGARKLPAYIWNQGGLGQASSGVTEVGARRGYAAMCIDFPQIGYRSSGGYDINSGLTLPEDPRQAPIYHGAVALLKAVSYLESRDEVDNERIGMAGASWGGFFTTLMAGIDPRLKVASSLYGTGNLQIGNAWWDGQSKNGRAPPDAAGRERWRQTLDPALRLPSKSTPMAWFTGVNDGFYLLPSIMLSHQMTPGPKHLMLVPNWHHALPRELHDEPVLAWLDVHLRGRAPFVTVEPITVRKEGERLIAEWEFAGDGASADLIASYGEAGNWRGRHWRTIPSSIEGKKCRAEIPAGTLTCYVSGSVQDKSGIRASTPLVEVEASKLGIRASVPVPDYDGCTEWGGFEEPHIAYLTRHDRSGQTRWIPKVSPDAKEGKQSAILPPHSTTLAPILYTATLPHRFSCFLKSDRPIEIGLQLAGEKKEFAVGTGWTEFNLDFTLPNDLMGYVTPVISVPPEAVVLLDAVSVHPILKQAGR